MNNFKHVMVDLETFARTPDAAITAIGAILFDPDQGCVGEQAGEMFYRTIDLANSNQPGRIDPDTVMWWLGQSEEARTELRMGGPRRRLGHALAEFEEWLKTKGCNKDTKNDWMFWANDPDFDLTILQSAYERYGLPIPWSFRGARSMRTMCMLAKQFKLVPEKEARGGTHHNALDDAAHQALVITTIQQALKTRIGS